MRERSGSSRGAPTRPAPFAIEVVVVTTLDRQLAVLSVRPERSRTREPWELPWGTLRGGEGLDAAARRIVRPYLGVEPAWMEQIGGFSDGRRVPSSAELSICFVGVVADGSRLRVPQAAAWAASGDRDSFGARQRAMVDAGLRALRLRMDYAPIPFRLLPPLFTLSDLQQIYELLLVRRLHKASFRRALHAAWLVEPTDEWRSEGRGRPAQLFRFAPRKRRGHRRGARFDLL